MNTVEVKWLEQHFAFLVLSARSATLVNSITVSYLNQKTSWTPSGFASNLLQSEISPSGRPRVKLGLSSLLLRAGLQHFTLKDARLVPVDDCSLGLNKALLMVSDTCRSDFSKQEPTWM